MSCSCGESRVLRLRVVHCHPQNARVHNRSEYRARHRRPNARDRGLPAPAMGRGPRPPLPASNRFCAAHLQSDLPGTSLHSPQHVLPGITAVSPSSPPHAPPLTPPPSPHPRPTPTAFSALSHRLRHGIDHPFAPLLSPIPVDDLSRSRQRAPAVLEFRIP